MEGTAGLARNLKDGRCWRGFQPGSWCDTIDVRDFIVRNVTPYSGDEAFLAGPSNRTKAVWEKLQPYFRDERKKGVLAVESLGGRTVRLRLADSSPRTVPTALDAVKLLAGGLPFAAHPGNGQAAFVVLQLHIVLREARQDVLAEIVRGPLLAFAPY